MNLHGAITFSSLWPDLVKSHLHAPSVPAARVRVRVRGNVAAGGCCGPEGGSGRRGCGPARGYIICMVVEGAVCVPGALTALRSGAGVCARVVSGAGASLWGTCVECVQPALGHLLCAHMRSLAGRMRACPVWTHSRELECVSVCSCKGLVRFEAAVTFSPAA